MAEITERPPGRAERMAALLDKLPDPVEGEEDSADEAEPEAEKPEGDEPEAEAEEGEGESEEASEEEEAEKPTAKPKEESTAKGLAAIARRDKEQRAQHAQRQGELKQYEAQLVAAHQQIAKREKDVAAREELALTDLPAYLESRGVKSDDFRAYAEQLYHAHLGKDAPPEARANKAAWTATKKAEQALAQIEQQKQEIAQEKAQLAEERNLGEYRQRLMAGVATLPEGTYPFLRTLAAHAPGDAAEQLLRLAQQVYAENAAGQPQGWIPTIEDIAPLLDERLSAKISPFLPKKTTPAADKKTTAPPKTLTTNHNGRTPPKPTAKTRDERRDETLRRLRRGDVD